MMESACDSVVNSVEIDRLIYFKILIITLISYSGLKIAHIEPLNFSGVILLNCVVKSVQKAHDGHQSQI